VRNGNQLVLGQFGEHGDHRQAADEFRDEAEAEQVLGFDVLKNLQAVNGGRFVSLFPPR